MAKIKALFGVKQETEPKTDFSSFFYKASSGEKKKLLLEVVRGANKDQRELVKLYNSRYSDNP